MADIAKQIAEFITQQAAENSDNGSWAVYFDEIEDEFGVDLSEDKKLAEKVIDAFDYEKVAEAELMEDGYDIVMYLDYCDNIEDDVWAERGFGESKEVSKGKALKEGKWNYTLELGSALRSAIESGDPLGVCAMLQCCYQELAEAGIIDDYDSQEAIDDIDAIDLEDEDAEDEIDYYLEDFWDLCDNLNVFVPLTESKKAVNRKSVRESFKKRSSKKALKEEFNGDRQLANRFSEKISEFGKVASELLDIWYEADDEETNDLFAEGYPFDIDFQEMPLKIWNWRDTIEAILDGDDDFFNESCKKKPVVKKKFEI